VQAKDRVRDVEERASDASHGERRRERQRHELVRKQTLTGCRHCGLPAVVSRQEAAVADRQDERVIRLPAGTTARDILLCAVRERAGRDRRRRGPRVEPMRGEANRPYVMFVDLGAVHDPTVIAIGHRQGDAIYIDRLVTFQGSREEPVHPDGRTRDSRTRGTVSAHDDTIESWQGLAAAQTLQ
jgi:hypothetical protein